MKNVTFSADEALLERAREKARSEHRSLNEVFRQWLAEWARDDDRAARYDELMTRLAEQTRAPRHFPRDELNER